MNVRTELINQNYTLASTIGNYTFIPSSNSIKQSVLNFKKDNSLSNDLNQKILMLQQIYQSEGVEFKG
jgi:hypothetical protein